MDLATVAARAAAASTLAQEAATKAKLAASQLQAANQAIGCCTPQQQSAQQAANQAAANAQNEAGIVANEALAAQQLLEAQNVRP